MFTDPYLAASFAAFADHEPEQAFLSLMLPRLRICNLCYNLSLTRYYIICAAGVHDVHRDCREHPGAASLHEQDLIIVGNVAFWNRRNKFFLSKSAKLLAKFLLSLFLPIVLLINMIRFQNLDFKYKKTSSWSLRNFNEEVINPVRSESWQTSKLNLRVLRHRFEFLYLKYNSQFRLYKDVASTYHLVILLLITRPLSDSASIYWAAWSCFWTYRMSRNVACASSITFLKSFDRWLNSRMLICVFPYASNSFCTSFKTCKWSGNSS